MARPSTTSMKKLHRGDKVEFTVWDKGFLKTLLGKVVRTIDQTGEVLVKYGRGTIKLSLDQVKRCTMTTVIPQRSALKPDKNGDYWLTGDKNGPVIFHSAINKGKFFVSDGIKGAGVLLNHEGIQYFDTVEEAQQALVNLRSSALTGPGIAKILDR